jgi:hypothetical protein
MITMGIKNYVFLNSTAKFNEDLAGRNFVCLKISIFKRGVLSIAMLTLLFGTI